MINWLVRHLDALQDRYKELLTADNLDNFQSFPELVLIGIYAIIKNVVKFLIIALFVEICWVIVNW